LFVVIWEPKTSVGGGHQLVMDWQQADRLCSRLTRERREFDVRIETAEQHSCNAVRERLQRRQGAQFTPYNRRSTRGQYAR
jgi:hypothetical protein